MEVSGFVWSVPLQTRKQPSLIHTLFRQKFRKKIYSVSSKKTKPYSTFTWRDKIVASQSFEKIPHSIIQIFRQQDVSYDSSIKMPHLFVGQMKPLETDSKINLEMLGIFASCVIVFSTIFKKIVEKGFLQRSKAQSPSKYNINDEQHVSRDSSQVQLAKAWLALQRLKDDMNNECEHASDLFAKYLEIEDGETGRNVTLQDMIDVISDILRDVDKKQRYYHSLVSTLEKFSQQAIHDVESSFEQSVHDSGLETLRSLAQISTNKMEQLSISQFYGQLRHNASIKPITQRCENVSVDIMRMKTALLSLLNQSKEMKSQNSNMHHHDHVQDEQEVGSSQVHSTQITLKQLVQTLQQNDGQGADLVALQEHLETLPEQDQWSLIRKYLYHSFNSFNQDHTGVSSFTKVQKDKEDELNQLRRKVAELEIKLKSDEETQPKRRTTRKANKVTSSGDASTIKKTRGRKKSSATDNEGSL